MTGEKSPCKLRAQRQASCYVARNRLPRRPPRRKSILCPRWLCTPVNSDSSSRHSAAPTRALPRGSPWIIPTFQKFRRCKFRSSVHDSTQQHAVIALEVRYPFLYVAAAAPKICGMRCAQFYRLGVLISSTILAGSGSSRRSNSHQVERCLGCWRSGRAHCANQIDGCGS